MASATNSVKYWWLKGEKIGIGYLSTDTNENDSLTAVDEIKEISVVYDEELPDLSALTDSPSIPSRFHESIVAKAIQKGFEINPDPNFLQVAQYWAAQFEFGLKRIQEFKNKAYTKVIRIVKTNRPYAIK
jgi:hypothetical protein|tara:strand:- start:340 stop:729 length:390 start_codon:yes stop_codon:yes gene_type:complete